MRTYTWEEFCEEFWDWSEQTVKAKIPAIKTIGSGSELLEIVFNIEDEESQVMLLNKAMKLGVKFERRDFIDLDGDLPDDIYSNVRLCGF